MQPSASTETSEPARGQRRFQKRLLVFFGPLLLVVLAAETLLWRTREGWAVPRAIEFQREHPGALFMRGLLDQAFYPYKLQNILQREPKILVLGSSRVMEFRSEMFDGRAADFYNAGGMIQDLGDLSHFAESLTVAAPEIVILGLDLWWFNEALPLGHGLRDRASYDAARDWQAHVKAWRRFKSSRVRKPLFRALSAENGHIGIEARNSGAGFRADGSMEYNLAIPTNAAGWAFVDREKPPVAERIRNGISQFAPQRGRIDARIGLLERSLDALARRGVLVAGFLPPFSAESARLLENSPAHGELWRAVRAAVPEVFKKRGLPFVDASVAANLNLDDRHLIDGIHGAETFHLHLLRRLLADPKVRSRLPGLEQSIGAWLSHPATNPWKPSY